MKIRYDEPSIRISIIITDREHIYLGKDSPEPRAIQPPEMGSVAAVPQVGGLHHRYERRAA
jgi:hypothetical protein